MFAYACWRIGLGSLNLENVGLLDRLAKPSIGTGAKLATPGGAHKALKRDCSGKPSGRHRPMAA